jgi:hypothetical protein
LGHVGTWYLNAENTAGIVLRFLKLLLNFCLKLTKKSAKDSVPECGRPLEEYYPEWPRIDRPASEHNFASPLLPEHRNLMNKKTGSVLSVYSTRLCIKKFNDYTSVYAITYSVWKYNTKMKELALFDRL